MRQVSSGGGGLVFHTATLRPAWSTFPFSELTGNAAHAHAHTTMITSVKVSYSVNQLGNRVLLFLFRTFERSLEWHARSFQKHFRLWKRTYSFEFITLNGRKELQ